MWICWHRTVAKLIALKSCCNVTLLVYNFILLKVTTDQNSHLFSLASTAREQDIPYLYSMIIYTLYVQMHECVTFTVISSHFFTFQKTLMDNSKSKNSKLLQNYIWAKYDILFKLLFP